MTNANDALRAQILAALGDAILRLKRQSVSGRFNLKPGIQTPGAFFLRVSCCDTYGPSMAADQASCLDAAVDALRGAGLACDNDGACVMILAAA